MLALNSYRGLRKADDQLILDRAFPLAWFYPIDENNPSLEAVKQSYAAHQKATKTTNPNNLPDYTNEIKFEKRPRRSVDLADFMADVETVNERVDGLVGVDQRFGK